MFGALSVSLYRLRYLLSVHAHLSVVFKPATHLNLVIAAHLGAATTVLSFVLSLL